MDLGQGEWTFRLDQWNLSTLTLEKMTPRGQARSVFDVAGDVLTYEVSSRVTGTAEFSPVMKGTFGRNG